MYLILFVNKCSIIPKEYLWDTTNFVTCDMSRISFWDRSHISSQLEIRQAWDKLQKFQLLLWSQQKLKFLRLVSCLSYLKNETQQGWDKCLTRKKWYDWKKKRYLKWEELIWCLKNWRFVRYNKLCDMWHVSRLILRQVSCLISTWDKTSMWRHTVFACSYCMCCDVLISSRIYLYSSYFEYWDRLFGFLFSRRDT